ncbi:MAG: hypothetical protein JWR09_5869, partial [Mucilaginibacter sp.]|nr:hypothetical protein [Mucilaginibacter sp.]
MRQLVRLGRRHQQLQIAGRGGKIITFDEILQSRAERPLQPES